LSKLSGLGATITCADASGTVQTVSDDISEFSFSTPVALQDVTGVDKYAHQRIALLADITVDFKGTFDPGTDLAHEVFSSIPSSPTVVRAVSITPTASEYPFLPFNALLSAYDISRSATGELTFDVPGSLADGAVPTWTNAA
jgi:hypothetical protein